MWNKDNELEDTKCLIPDRSYGSMYQEMVSYVKTNGQFDVATMGNVANVGLMVRFNILVVRSDIHVWFILQNI
jgi:monomeric isocitrate dehydrogenase